MTAQLDGPANHISEYKIPGTNLSMCLDHPKSRGAWLYEQESGTDYLDLTGFMGARALGFNHRRLSDSTKQARAATQLSGDGIEQLRARMLANVMARGFAALKLSDSGDSALAYAIGVAIRRRNEHAAVIHFAGSGHQGIEHPAMVQAALACPSVPSTQGSMSQSATQEESGALSSLESAASACHGNVAAVVVESIQSSCGDQYIRPAFLQSLRGFCDRVGALLVVDEVESGFGRSGCWWDCEHSGVVPDIIVFGGIAQLGGVLLREDLIPLLETVAEPPAAAQIARCNAILDAMEEEELVGHAGLMGRYLDHVLTELSMKFPAVSNTRARGLRAAFDLPSCAERDALTQACIEEHLLVLPSGVRSISLRPTLDVRPDAIGRGIAQLEAALRRVYG